MALMGLALIAILIPGCITHQPSNSIVVELHGSDDTLWIYSRHISKSINSDLLKNRYGVSIRTQANRVGLVGQWGNRQSGYVTYHIPLHSILSDVGIEVADWDFGIKSNRLVALRVQNSDLPPSYSTPYPVYWLNSVPEVLDIEARVLPKRLARPSISLWLGFLGLVFVCTVTYLSRPSGSKGQVVLAMYYALNILTFVFFFASGLGFVWTWLIGTRMVGLAIGVIVATINYLVPTALVIRDHIRRSGLKQTHSNVRQSISRSLLLWLPSLVALVGNAFLLTLMPDNMVETYGGPVVVTVVLQVVLLFSSYCLSPLLFRLIFHPDMSIHWAQELTLDLASKHSVMLRGFGRIPKVHMPEANAFIAGILPFYRFVFISDSSFELLTKSEIEAVVAHELSHVRCKHAWIIIATCGIYAVLAGMLLDWLTVHLAFGMVQILTLPVALFLLLFGYTALNRRLEYQADREAVRLIGNPASLITTLQKLDGFNGASTNRPISAILSTHPLVDDRIRALQSL